MHLDPSLWLPILAMLLGAVTHSLSADGGASVLSHFGINARLPASAVVFAVLLSGFGSDAVESYVNGADWQHALATAATAALTSIFGAVAHHAATSGRGGGGSSSGGGGKVVGFGSAPPSGPSSKPAARIGFGVMTIAALALAVILGGCKPSNTPKIPSADLQCVADDVLINGVTDPAQVIKDCPNLSADTLSALAQIVEGLLGTGKDMQTPANVSKRAATVKDGGK